MPPLAPLEKSLNIRKYVLKSKIPHDASQLYISYQTL